jgi:two-component SAPR family response regulator
MTSSILQQMTPSSCDFIFKRDDSSKILNYLVNKNLFTTCIDKESQVFSYHQLFRNFLLNKLSTEENESVIRKYHLRAGEYFEKETNYPRSVEHYFLANNLKEVIKIVEKIGEDLIGKGEFNIVNRWLEKIPNESIKDNPTLLFLQAEILRYSGELEGAVNLYKEAQKLFLKSNQTLKSIKPALGIAYFLLVREKYKELLKLTNELLEIIGQKDSYSEVRILGYKGMALNRLNKCKEAISSYSKGLKIAQKIGTKKGEILLLANLSNAYANNGEPTKSFQMLKQAAEKAQTLEYLRERGIIYSNLATRYHYRGDFNNARYYIKRAFQENRKFNNIRGLALTFEALGWLNLLKGDYSLARLCAKRALKLNEKMKEIGITDGSLDIISLSYVYKNDFITAERWFNKIRSKSNLSLTWGEIKFGLGDFDSAERLFKLSLKEKYSFDLMLANAKLARIYYKKYDIQGVHKYLKKAFELSQKYEYDFSLLRYGRLDFSILQFAIKNNIMPEYANFLIKELEKQYDFMVHFLGGLRIKSNGKDIDLDWKTQKEKSLFCYLLANKGKKFTGDQLMELLWAGKGFKKSQSSFYTQISFLKTTLSPLAKPGYPIIEHKEMGYKFNSKYKVWTDVEEFEKAINEAQEWKSKDEAVSIERYEVAKNLYQGDFINELYDLWVDEMRMHYKQKYLQVLNELSLLYTKKREFQKVITNCELIIRINELYEPAYLGAIKAYMEIKDYKTALNLYDQLERVLKKELNTSPSSEAKNLYSKLKAHL